MRRSPETRTATVRPAQADELFGYIAALSRSSEMPWEKAKHGHRGRRTALNLGFVPVRYLVGLQATCRQGPSGKCRVR
jgi:hypothetical protein